MMQKYVLKYVLNVHFYIAKVRTLVSTKIIVKEYC